MQGSVIAWCYAVRQQTYLLIAFCINRQYGEAKKRTVDIKFMHYQKKIFNQSFYFK